MDRPRGDLGKGCVAWTRLSCITEVCIGGESPIGRVVQGGIFLNGLDGEGVIY